MIRKLIISIWLVIAAIHANAGNSVYNIKEYGAVADTLQLSTNAIQEAIDDCAKNGGGVVWIPAGNYLTTSILLRSNVNLHLDAGSTLYASRKVSDYKNSKLKIGASDAHEAQVILCAVNSRNISITGTGKLHCQGMRRQFRRERQLAVTDSVTGREIANAEKYGADYQTKYRRVDPSSGAINFTNCTNVHIRDIEVIESSFWSVHLQWCDRVFVEGIHIQSSSADGVNSDGLDIDGCSNVLINNCVINTGDDALCLKTTRQNEQTRPCRWITISNCILTSSSAALKIGTESHADFEFITVSNCAINNANRGLNMIIRDGGHVRNVIFSDIVINTVRKATFWWGNGDPVWLTIQKRGDRISAGSIENVTFNNIIAHGQGGVRLEGFDNFMNNIRFTNFQLFLHPEDAVDKRSRNGFLFYGVNKLRMVDCEVNWDCVRPEKEWESAYHFEHSKDIRLIRATGEQAPNKRFPAFRFSDVQRVQIDGKDVKVGEK